MADVHAVNIARHDEQLGDHQEKIKSLWSAVEKIRDRPPAWVSFVFAGAGFIIGILVTLLAQCAK